jgi:large subunit ribosomal protein L25
MEELVIEVERRSSTGKGHNRKLRRQGTIPAVVYGGGKESVPVSIDRHAVTELLRQEKGRNTVFLLKMKGTKQERQAMLRDAQIDPLTRQYIHLDFIRVMKGQRLKVEVPIALEGESIGVKGGGFLDWLSRSLHIECAAESIPSSLVIDISALDVGDHVIASQLPLPEGARLIDDPNKLIVAIAAHGAKAEAEPAAAAAPVEEGAEPEVIRRGKAAEEESEE